MLQSNNNGVFHTTSSTKLMRKYYIVHMSTQCDKMETLDR